MATVLIAPRHQVILRGVSWSTYQALSRDLVSQPGKRLTYDQGTLEITVGETTWIREFRQWVRAQIAARR